MCKKKFFHFDPIKLLSNVSSNRAASNRDVFRLGVSSNLSGHTRELCTGIAVALKEYLNHEERLYDIEILWEESTLEENSSSKAANRLINNGVEAVIGHLSANQSLAVTKIYSDVGIPFFAPGTSHPLLTEQGFDNVLRFYGRDETMADEMVNLANCLGGNNVTVVHQKNEYGKQLAKFLGRSVIERGLNLKECVIFNKDYEPITNSREIILFAGTYEGALELIYQLSALNYKGSVIFGDDIFVSDFPYFIKHQEGIKLYTVSTKKHLCGFNYSDFTSKYLNTASFKPAAYSITSYLATKFLLNNLNILRKSGYRELIDIAKKGFIQKGIHDKISFNPKGDFIQFEWDIYEIKKGDFNTFIQE